LKRKVALVIALIFSVLVLTLGTAIYYYNQNKQTEPKPIAGHHPPLYTTTMSTLNSEVDIIGRNGGAAYDNISQGTLFQVNLTFISKTNQQILIPLENLTVSYYNSTVDRKLFFSSDKSYPVIQALAFNYSFSLNPIILQPNMSNSTILTINLADDAPVGQYILAIHTARIIGNDTSYFTVHELEMIVTPKGT
jgi:hypothetical protein